MVAGTIQQDKSTSHPADTQTQGNLQPQTLHWRPPTSNPRQTKPQKPPRTQAADPPTMPPGNSPQEQTRTNRCSWSLPNPPRAHNKRPATRAQGKPPQTHPSQITSQENPCPQPQITPSPGTHKSNQCHCPTKTILPCHNSITKTSWRMVTVYVIHFSKL